MSVRVRFAPSPTGYLHIGGARTALYSYLYARATGGTFILRIEDTDEERSRREYETAQIEDLKWVGIAYDEGPDKPGQFGPYRQSERLETYKKIALDFVERGLAFHCFCTDEELEQKREQAMAQNRDPHYDGTCRKLAPESVQQRLQAGEKASIRFIKPHKTYQFCDIVRGEVSFPENMVGDFVIMRSNGRPVYNFCCVVDDYLMQMTHVLRAEEHLNNTLRQLMIYEALGATPPQFGHVSLLIGKDRQKLSKRHGATSVTQYREQAYLPEAMLNYLILLGWSHPEEKEVFDLQEVLKVFDLNRFNKAPAMFDLEKLKHINGQHLRAQSLENLVTMAQTVIPQEHEWQQQSPNWKQAFMHLFIEKIQVITEINQYLDDVFASHAESSPEIDEALSWESTPQIKSYLQTELNLLQQNGQTFVEAEQFNQWMNHCKKELKIKGKPLFMGLRVVLTGRTHGPDLKQLIPLTPLQILLKRLG